MYNSKISKISLSEETNHILNRVRDNPVYVQYLNTKSSVRVERVQKRNLKAIHGSFDVVLIDFYDVLLNPPDSFRALMYDLKLGDFDSVVNGVKELRCGYGGKVYVPNVIATGKLNPYRKYYSHLVSVSRLVKRLMWLGSEYGIDYMFHVVLTMPKEFSLRYAVDVDKGKRLMKKALKIFIKKMEKEFYGELGYTYNIHIWNNRLEPHFHIHMNMLNAVYDGYEFHRFKPWLDEVLIKKLWKESIEKVLEQDLDCVDVHIKYAPLNDRSRIMHWLKYASRHPLVDIVSYYSDKPYHGLTDLEKNWYLTLIFYENRRVLGGYLRKLKKFLGDQEEKEKKHYCPLCGFEAQPGSYTPKEYLEQEFEKGNLVILFWEKAYYLICSENCYYDSLLNSGG